MKKLVLSLSVVAVLALMWLVIPEVRDAGAQGPANNPPTVPFLKEWQESGHADKKALAFTDWDDTEKKEVPETCAKCHTTPGHLDFLGVDGSEAGKVNKPVPIGSVVECVACHNEVNLNKTSVVMPSGVEVKGLGREARCMECHQGRESKVSVDKTIADAAVKDEDTIGEKLTFRNIHYFAAAATKYGSAAKGGYQYDGKSYDSNFAHVAEFNTCIDCHNSHTLKLNVEACAKCHAGVKKVEDLRNVRMAGSVSDYDGDGNVEEGIYFEVEGLRDVLYKAIQAYGNEKSKLAIAYNKDAYPYFFSDTNKDGKADEKEAVRENAYKGWTPRLVKAAYNYQVSLKDPGAYAHGGKYIIQLLYDSIEDLNKAIAKPIDISKAHRIDSGHFAGSEAAFHRWDEPGVIPANCSKCHSAGGLPLFLKDGGATISQPLANGFQCTTCHQPATMGLNEKGEFKPKIYEVKEVKFPSGETIKSEQPTIPLLCSNCHQGRESTTSVNALIKTAAAKDDNTVSDKLAFRNIHYYAAGATRYGTQVKGAYEYEGQKYNGFYPHVKEAVNCNDCHDVHALEVKVESCTECHATAKDEKTLRTIREATTPDFDGDGDKKEGIDGEIETLKQKLYEAIQKYAGTTPGTKKVAYTPQSNPYFFLDTNGNGKVDPDEAKSDNRYNTWTPRLLRAAFNYQYATKDPGVFTHNARYVIQALYDSLKDMGGDVSKMTRPEVK